MIEVEDPAHRDRSALALTQTEPTDAVRAMVAALRTEAARIALAPTTGPSGSTDSDGS